MSAGPLEECCTLGVFLKERRRELSAQIRAIGSHPRPPVRIGRAVTQEEIAEAVGVSRVWYAQIESGRGSVSLRLLMRIAEALMLGPEDRRALVRLTLPGIAILLTGESPSTATRSGSGRREDLDRDGVQVRIGNIR
ncbi:MAG TPA: helix-turn-helix transcriptional regulator [Candidatus Baltobacteraceae bacterium]